MCKMKYSGVEWIGDIPEEWSLNKLRYIYNIKGGNGFSDEFQGNTTGDIPFCKCSDINGNSKHVYTAQNYVNYDIVKKNNYNLIPKNSLIFAKIGEAMKKNHRKINSVECCIDNNVQALILKNNNFDNNYGYYFMKNIDMSDFDNGGPIPSINNTKLNNLIVTYPNIKEQKLIANFLEEKTTNLDNILFDLNKQIEILTSYKKSIITETVTKGLNKNIELKDSGIVWMGKIPVHWDIKPLKYLGNARNGLTYSPEDQSDNGVLVLRSSNIQNGKVSYDDNVYVKMKIPNNLFLKENDLLICSRNGSRNLIGKNILIDKNIIGNTYGAFMCVYRSKYNKYIHYVLNSNIFDYYLATFLTSTINQLTNSNLYSIKIAIPMDFEEQNEIIEYLDKKCEQIDKIIEEKQKQIEKIEEYKKSVIYEYVTGKKRVEGAEELYG